MPLGTVPGVGGIQMPPRHCAKLGGRERVLDAPFGTMPGAEGFSLWHPASGNGDPAAQVQAQGSSGIKDWTSPLPVPALCSKGACISLTQEVSSIRAGW